VKSGILIDAEFLAMDFYDKGEMADHAAASYTSIGGATLFLMASINPLNTK
jgi:hypothetical protein